MLVFIEKEARGEHPNYKKALIHSLEIYGDISTIEELKGNLDDARERARGAFHTHKNVADCMILWKLLEKKKNELKGS